MLSTWQFRILTFLALLLAVLVGGNIALALHNRETQGGLDRRNEYIQQSIQLNSLYQDVVNSLVNLSTRNNDSQLREMLEKNGVTFTPNPAVTPANPKEAR